VAYEVATRLNAPLDVIVVRKQELEAVERRERAELHRWGKLFRRLERVAKAPVGSQTADPPERGEDGFDGDVHIAADGSPLRTNRTEIGRRARGSDRHAPCRSRSSDDFPDFYRQRR
jgi:hypothetical protein